MALWDRLACADLNGRISSVATPPFATVTPAFKGEEMGTKQGLQTLLQAAQKIEKENTPICCNEDMITMTQEKASAISQKLTDQKEKITAADEKILSQDKMIQQLTDALVKARTPRRFEEETPQVSALRMENYELKQNLECKEAQVDSLLPKVVESHMKESQHLRNKGAEIQQLRHDLDAARAETAHCQNQLQDSQDRLDSKEAELERLLPQVLKGRISSSERDVEMEELRRQLEDARSELHSVKLQHHKTIKELEEKDSDVHHRLKLVSETQTKDLERLESKDAEIEHLRRQLEDSVRERRPQQTKTCSACQWKDIENERLRHQLDANNARKLHTQRQSQVEKLGDLSPVRIQQPADKMGNFLQAESHMQQYLARREQALNAREQALNPHQLTAAYHQHHSRR